MRHTRRFWLHVLIVVAIGASFCSTASSAPGVRVTAGLELQTRRTLFASNRMSTSEQEVDRVPLKDGLWEQTIFQGLQAVNGEVSQDLMCPDLYALSPFPSVTSSDNLGRFIPDGRNRPDHIWQLADGRYRVRGTVATMRGGNVTYEHLITVRDDEHYDDVVTVIPHARAHLKHVHSGSGRWLAPCPSPSK